MRLNHSKYKCFRKGPLTRIFPQNASPEAPKSELLASLLAPGAVFEPTSAPRGRSGDAPEPLCEKTLNFMIFWVPPGGADTLPPRAPGQVFIDILTAGDVFA